MWGTLLNLTNNAVSNFLTRSHGLKFLRARRNQYIITFSTTKSKIAVSNFVSCSLQLGGRRRSLDDKMCCCFVEGMGWRAV
jgi:hypothetical protein